MTTAPPTQPEPEDDDAQPLRFDRARFNGWAWRLALMLVWLWSWHHLAVEWRLNEQYQYGFAIPLLAAYLAWQRITSIPPGAISPVQRASIGYWACMVIFWGLFVFGELVREQDPTWRLAGGLMVLAATGLTVIWLWRWAGASVVRHMAVPLAFAWLALPWPSTLESGVTLHLMRLVTGWTVGFLNFSGVAAMQHGNTIELSNAMVGVDTACSGVQSFQASLVVALFLGEFYRFRWQRRVFLLLAGWLIALVGNLIRVYILTRLVHAEGGNNVEEKYHDWVGLAATVATFVSIFVLGWLLARKSGSTTPPETTSFDWRKQTTVDGVEGGVLCVAILLVPVLTWGWFSLVPGEGLVAQEQPLWQVVTDNAPLGWRIKEESFTAAERNILRYSEGTSIEARSPVGMPASLFHLFWKPESSVPSMAFSHSPDVCMPSAGWQLVGAGEPVEIKLHGYVLHGSLFRFRLEGVEQVAFHALWYGGRPESLEGHLVGMGNRGGRLARLWTGPRRKGHELLTVFLPPASDRQNQIAALEELLDVVLLPTLRDTPMKEL